MNLAELPWSLIAELLALGAVAGFLAGLLGVGGGMMMVPFLTIVLERSGVATGLSVKMAIATSMATIMFTSLSSLRAHHRHGAVRWPIVAAMAPGIVLGGLLAGGAAFAILKGQVLALIFALFVSFSATRMLTRSQPAPSRQMPGWAGTSAAGAGVGFMSGLVGAGGAFISVPFMTRCNVPIHQAVATSAALGFPIAMSNTLGYVVGGWNLPPALPGAVGFLWWPGLLLIACGSVSLAPLGARVAHRMNVAELRKAFAGLLYALSLYMLWKAFLG
jgi:uncharacterized membrane protein YfcA